MIANYEKYEGDRLPKINRKKNKTLDEYETE